MSLNLAALAPGQAQDGQKNPRRGGNQVPNSSQQPSQNNASANQGQKSTSQQGAKEPQNEQPQANLSVDHALIGPLQGGNASQFHVDLADDTLQVVLAPNNPTSGMNLESADEALREQLQLPKDQGLVVLSLDPHSAPAQAGIEENDVLLFVGDAPLGKPEDLDERLKGAGEEPVPLTVLRGGKKLKFQVQPRVRVTLGPVQAQPAAFWIGVSVSAIGPALRSQLQLPQDKGLAVIEVMKDSPAAKAGIKLHDILLTMDGKPLADQQKLIEVVQANGEKSVALEVVREGKTQAIEVKPERRKSVHVSARTHDPRTFYYVRPGAMLANPATGGKTGADSLYQELVKRQPQTFAWQQQPQTFAWRQQGTSQTKTKDANDLVSKRLDDLDAEIRQLRRAIEELSRAVKDR